MSLPCREEAPLRVDALLDLRDGVPPALSFVVHLVREVLLGAPSHRYSVWIWNLQFVWICKKPQRSVWRTEAFLHLKCCMHPLYHQKGLISWKRFDANAKCCGGLEEKRGLFQWEVRKWKSEIILSKPESSAVWIKLTVSVLLANAMLGWAAVSDGTEGGNGTMKLKMRKPDSNVPPCVWRWNVLVLQSVDSGQSTTNFSLPSNLEQSLSLILAGPFVPFCPLLISLLMKSANFRLEGGFTVQEKQRIASAETVWGCKSKKRTRSEWGALFISQTRELSSTLWFIFKTYVFLFRISGLLWGVHHTADIPKNKKPWQHVTLTNCAAYSWEDILLLGLRFIQGMSEGVQSFEWSFHLIFFQKGWQICILWGHTWKPKYSYGKWPNAGGQKNLIHWHGWYKVYDWEESTYLLYFLLRCMERRT